MKYPTLCYLKAGRWRRRSAEQIGGNRPGQLQAWDWTPSEGSRRRRGLRRLRGLGLLSSNEALLPCLGLGESLHVGRLSSCMLGCLLGKVTDDINAHVHGRRRLWNLRLTVTMHAITVSAKRTLLMPRHLREVPCNETENNEGE